LSAAPRASALAPSAAGGLAGRLAAAAVALLLVYLVVVPLVLLGVSSVRPTGFPLEAGFTFANFGKVFLADNFPRLVWTTIVFALGSTALAMVLGTALAWLVERTDLPGRNLFRVLVILPMATPPVLLAIGWATSLRDGPLRRALAFAASGLPITVLLAWVGGSWLYARFLLFALPATALLLAVGSRGLIDATATGRQALSLRIARSLVVPLAIASCLAYDLGSQPRQPIREAVAQVADLRGPGDRVLGVGIADDVVQWYALTLAVPVEPTGVGGERLREALSRTDATWIVALYPDHRHPDASGEALSGLGFRRRPVHGLPGWLDAGEGTVEVWRREPSP